MAETLYPGVALVTGAAGTGIGSGVALAFAEAGCRSIAITDRNEELLMKNQEALTEQFPNAKIFALAGDITQEKFVDELIATVVQTFGRLDYCVNCAGIMGNNQISTETSLEMFDKINDVNYRGCWLSSRAEIKAMLNQEPLPSHDPRRPPQRGSIVNIASQLGFVGRPAATAYCASKAAVMAMTRGDAIDYAHKDIRVNCVCPGVIETPMTTSQPGRRELMAPAILIAPMKRMGQVAEIADCAIFLCSTKASFCQGSAMVVDGGYIIN
ncbi:oxidoreductase [Rhizodiscina lignyota]|uniref:Oxidoreductase n=1 Tax=Rhizodiscina lignyota TaxID=1504668 RepID=A0A9P4I559_9PEZI|nr:oxidoreductase [Rhizodiscina lignyota]